MTKLKMVTTDLQQVVPTRPIQAIRKMLLQACCHKLANNIPLQTFPKV